MKNCSERKKMRVRGFFGYLIPPLQTLVDGTIMANIQHPLLTPIKGVCGHTMVTHFVIYSSAALLNICSFGLGFAPPPPVVRSPAAPRSTRRCVGTLLYTSDDDDVDFQKGTVSSSTSTALLYPVISKIAGKEWTGSCRYVNSNLQHVKNLKLFGGVKYDIDDGKKLTLSSFLTFPNGQTRQVVMQGERRSGSNNENSDDILTLNPVENGGPIVMKLSEIAPDTILINEVEKESGRIIMTSSISIVQTQRGIELVGVSHEVGDAKDVIEGHQLWRMMDRSAQQKVVLSREFE
ncbi:hypothetical protein ACHAXM_003529 [Skeletonema potamos]|jgi:hypothetical protein